MKSTQSPLDQYRQKIETWVSVGGYSNPDVVRALTQLGVSTSERSIRRALRRWGLPAEDQGFQGQTKITGDDAILTSKPSLDYSNPEDLLKERGLEPEEWEVTSVTVNEWDSPTGDVLKQLKVNCRRIKDIQWPEWPEPAQINVDLPKARPKKNTGQPRRVVCVGDHQAPYHDKELHALFLNWIDVNRPDEGIFIGDTIDLPKISRHPDDPVWAATTQECVNAAGQIIYDYRAASPETQWKKLAGNHDERLRRAVINNIADFYGLKPAEVEELPDLPSIHSPRLLLRLDELGVEFIEPNGSYDHAQVRISDFLAARHGWIARKNSGASAHATLDHLGHSIIVGHTHRQSRVHQTKFTIDGKPIVNTAVETGCMCRIEDGLGYAVAPDWQNGFAVAEVWPDGRFSIDLATYVDGVLLYRDQRYS